VYVRYFEGAIATGLQLGDTRRLDVEPDRLEVLAELDRQRQSDVAQADDTDLAVSQAEFVHRVELPGGPPAGSFALLLRPVMRIGRMPQIPRGN
jgi:hypothetical protein